MESEFDVVIVGAGPVGLLTAIELTLNGARTIVLERLSAPSQVLKAGGIGPLGAEALQRRGMSAALAGATQASAINNVRAKRAHGSRYSGHFAGLILIRADAQKEPERLGAQVEQPVIEAMLSARAHALGVTVRRDCEVLDLKVGDEGVDMACVSAGGETQIHGSWLVGCDGGHSSVRKLAGFAFPGSDPTLTMYQAVAEVDHPERLASAGFHHTPGGMYMMLAGRLALLDFRAPPADRQAPVTYEEFDAVLRRVSGADVHLKSFENASRWTDNTRLVTTYRQGRVLLAGDAAHIHSPFGGQGLSLGLLDAANLGFKLAAVVRGAAPEGLLDTYTAERRPVAQAVLNNTLAQTAIMRPDPQSSAMRDLVGKLMAIDDANQFFGEMMSNLNTRYDLGSDQDEVGRLIGDRPLCGHGDGATLYGLMQGGKGVFLDASVDGMMTKHLGVNAPRVCCATVDAGPSMLIRPDACVAWAGDETMTEALRAALQRWFPA